MIEYKVTVDKYGTRWHNADGQLHREDGPAIETAGGTKAWYHNGKRHREDAPAIEYASGNKVWCRNGKRHREDGPAFEWADGGRWWYLNGEKLTEEEFIARTTKKSEEICCRRHCVSSCRVID